MEEDRGFCAFDVTTRPTRIWNEGASGVVFDLRCAYQCWQQDEQVNLSLKFGRVDRRAGRRAGSHRSLHEFGEVPTEYIPEASSRWHPIPGIPALQNCAPVFTTAAHQTDT
ncbi:hypothetical protein TcYC6_0035550 [Trypanosoma cruzi]|nr:hypothetical protein TcYC6_0035550 [Trypanosoma cruzi]